MRINTDNPKVNYTIDFYSFNIISSDKEVRSKYMDVPIEIYDGFSKDFQVIVDNYPIDDLQTDPSGYYVLDAKKYFKELKNYRFAYVRALFGRDTSVYTVYEFKEYVKTMINFIG